MKKIFIAGSSDFEDEVSRLAKRGVDDASAVEEVVADIIKNVSERGDDALVEYTVKFDRMEINADELRVPASELERAHYQLPDADRSALELAARRIRAFHERQKKSSWFMEEEGIILGRRVTPLDSVGLYVPGGTAAYPSSVLMNAIPAVVAGVNKIVMVSPTPGGEINSHVLAAAWICGVREVYRVGGAQAVAALAHGTETIPRVDKIVGPGNIYVATAKRMVYGMVDIDMVAGPSEILVVNDGSGNPSHIAADLLSQAEHDELATAVLVTTDASFAEETAIQVEKRLEELPRRDTARNSWDKRGGILLVDDMEKACEIANRFATEHLELAVENPWEVLGQIRHAGAIFLGHHTPEALGDYVAGPNHVLPTAGTARFFSPLGVDDFVKSSSVISFTQKALKGLSKEVMHIARLEGLEAHARAVEARVKEE